MSCNCIAAVKRAAGEGHSARAEIRRAYDHGHPAAQINEALYEGSESRVGTLRPVSKAGTMIDAFGVDRPDLVSKAGKELLHVGEHAVGHGFGPGTQRAARAADHGARRAFEFDGKKLHGGTGASPKPPKGPKGGAYNIRTEEKFERNIHGRVGLTATGAVVGIAGASAGVEEGRRRYNNHRGTNIKAADPYLHPINTSSQRTALSQRTLSNAIGRSADRAEGKGKDASRRREVQNRYAWSSGANNRVATHGYFNTLHHVHGAGRYDPKKKYDPPQQIGKAYDAFGVERPDLIEKLDLGMLGDAAKTVLKAPKEAGAGFFHGAKGGSFGQVKGGDAGQLGALGGKLTRTNVKPLAIGAGVGAVGAGGAALATRRN